MGYTKSIVTNLLSLRHPLLSVFGALVLSVIMIAFTTLPGDSMIIKETSVLLGGTDLSDAIGHVMLTGLLTVAWYGCLLQFCRRKVAIGIALLITLSLGTGTELLQNVIPQRGESWLDLAANWIGPLSFALWLHLRSYIRGNAQLAFLRRIHS